MIIVPIQFFTEDELKCKCGCGILNMTDQHLKNIDVLRYAIGLKLKVTSGCRCKEHNKNVGGVTTSRHECTTKQADATDLTCENIVRLFNTARQLGIFKEVILYEKSDFVHVATFPEKKFNYYTIEYK